MVVREGCTKRGGRDRNSRDGSCGRGVKEAGGADNDAARRKGGRKVVSREGQVMARWTSGNNRYGR